jgi:hypothetical protein
MIARVISLTLATALLAAPAAFARTYDELQAPRGQDTVQAPRGQEPVQAPRADEIQAPRG